MSNPRLDAVIMVDRWYSLCSACNRDCDPMEKCHDTILCFGQESNNPGCGARFVAIKANTVLSSNERHEKEILRQMRPDLTVI